MEELTKKINAFFANEFIFSPCYKLWRHILYWAFHTILFLVFWLVIDPTNSFTPLLSYILLWIPGLILISYPLAYGAIPYLLLKGKVWQFILVVLAWGFAGIYINYGLRNYVYGPLQGAIIGFDYVPDGHKPGSYLCMTTSSAPPMIIRFFKLWTWKQRDWLQEQQQKITAELQLLKAQVHPHFLFNTLNNIYSFSLERSPKTPDLILKLSSLLSYMLYDCKAEEVQLEKEIGIMKNYIDLQKERYGNKIEISWNVEGDIKDNSISPLLMLPFLENAFKHGASEQIEKSWLSVDISVRQDILRCKISNSKNEYVPYSEKGIGVANVQKRLEFIYPGNYELSLEDKGSFFAVSLLVNVSSKTASSDLPLHISPIGQVRHDATLVPAYK